MDAGKRTSQVKQVVVRTFSLLLALSIGFFVFVVGSGYWMYSQFPNSKEMRGCLKTKLYQVDLCPKNSSYARLDQISESLKKSVVLTEDSAFYDHKGFDFSELEKSFKKNLAEGRYARGGSTITQQLAKNLYLTKEKTIQRKALEALITIQLEKHLSKKEILERYLNVVQFGKDLFGVKRASEFYFKKQPSNLSVVESAWLTYLLPSPEKYSASFTAGKLTPFARKRMEQIVGNLFRYHKISEEEYSVARTDLSRFLTGGETIIESDFDLDSDLDLELETEPEFSEEEL